MWESQLPQKDHESLPRNVHLIFITCLSNARIHQIFCYWKVRPFLFDNWLKFAAQYCMSFSCRAKPEAPQFLRSFDTRIHSDSAWATQIYKPHRESGKVVCPMDDKYNDTYKGCAPLDYLYDKWHVHELLSVVSGSGRRHRDLLNSGLILSHGSIWNRSISCSTHTNIPTFSSHNSLLQILRPPCRT